ncbi:MAG TPA: hypothetical protein VMB50_21090, partial [Myxococcales bacterium]|nr:hypothetical protein [Myxococcales bacterium]
MNARLLPIVILLASCPAGAAGPVAAPTPRVHQGSAADPAAWKAIEAAISQQKYQQAVDLLDERIAAARAADDPAEWSRALIKSVALRIALHGYETSVRFLRAQPWPDEPIARATLELYYAHALVSYYQAYSWEIAQREKTESKGPVDLQSWTRDEIFAEASRAYFAVWQLREDLGRRPVGSLGEFLRANDYPKGIRDTLRDAVSYLWVQFLENTAFWRAEHENEVYLLDYDRLLAGDPAAPASVKLDDPAVHPLLKIGAILDDLEAWHLKRGSREGALEARLERLRVLHASF